MVLGRDRRGSPSAPPARSPRRSCAAAGRAARASCSAAGPARSAGRRRPARRSRPAARPPADPAARASSVSRPKTGRRWGRRLELGEPLVERGQLVVRRPPTTRPATFPADRRRPRARPTRGRHRRLTQARRCRSTVCRSSRGLKLTASSNASVPDRPGRVRRHERQRVVVGLQAPDDQLPTDRRGRHRAEMLTGDEAVLHRGDRVLLDHLPRRRAGRRSR